MKIVASIIFFTCIFIATAQPDNDGACFKRAWYEIGVMKDYPALQQLPKGVSIIADTALKPANFVSQREEFERFMIAHALAQLNDRPLEEIRQSDIEADFINENYSGQKLRFAQSEHMKHNSKDMVVWIVNNSADTLWLPTQDGSVMALREAKDENGKWKPIEYWSFASCGVSYIEANIKPGKAVQFVLNRSIGDFKTKVRFKILGEKGFIYSNEFDEYISLCQLNEPIDYKEEDSNYYFTRFFKREAFRITDDDNMYKKK